MKIKVIPIRAGAAHVFLVIQDDMFFLVDAGGKAFASKVAKAITSRGFRLSDLQFIFLTHTHYDHAGGAAALKRMSGCKIILNNKEADFLIKGDHYVPAGTNLPARFISFLGRMLGKSYSGFPAAELDVLFDESMSLASFGFDAKIILTPGHTTGSSCLIIDKTAFVGDTLFNIAGKKYPPFANDTNLLALSWAKLLKEEVDWFYPAHGKRLNRAEVEKEAKRRKII